MPHVRYSCRCGFTLLDIMITIAVLAIVVAFAVPVAHSSNDRLHLTAAAWLLTSDIEFAQVMAISDPRRKVVMRFDPINNRYWIAYANTPATPIIRADTGEPYLVEFGIGRAETAAGVAFQVENVLNNEVRFDAHGGLENFNRTPRITLRMDRNSYPRLLLDIAPTTGHVKETFEKDGPGGQQGTGR